jgi:hypothetical protein
MEFLAGQKVVFTKKLRNNPKQKIRKARIVVLLKVALSNCLVGIAKDIATAIIKMKKGKTKSVGVHPFHSACSNGG